MGSCVDANTKSRVLQLATNGNTIRQIADRMGFTTDRVRRLVERAEERGDVPQGTLGRISTLRKPSSSKTVAAATAAAPQPEEGLRILAPHRRTASDMGRCTICAEPTTVVLYLPDLQVRLCRAHSRQVVDGVEGALRIAQRHHLQIGKG